MSPYPHSLQQQQNIFTSHKDAPWLWLLEVEVPTSAANPSRLRLVRNPKPIEWGEFSDGSAKEWLPFKFDIGIVQDDTEGTLRRIAVSASNVSREIQAVLEHYDGLLERRASIYLVNVNELDSRTPYWQAGGEVVSSSCDERNVTIEIGQVSIQSRLFPGQAVGKATCRHRYGGTACGYDTTRAGALQTCSRLFGGDNGCVVHGEDEETNGLPRLHPLRFGGFLGVPKKSGIGT